MNHKLSFSLHRGFAGGESWRGGCHSKLTLTSRARGLLPLLVVYQLADVHRRHGAAWSFRQRLDVKTSWDDGAA